MSRKSLLSLSLIGLLVVGGLMLSFGPCLADTGSASAAPSASVLIQAFAFWPSTLTVEKGTAVTWTSADRMVYKIKFDDFESGMLNRGDAFTHKFNETGTYNYAEASNPAMKGSIVVT
ncbi:MAG: copper-binding protein [Methanothrix sp.]